MVEPRRALLQGDARNRAFRTILQGLAVDVAVAVATVLITVFATASSWGELQWAVIGFSLLKTVAMAIAAYIMRRFIDKPGDAALPPSRPGQPNEPINPPNLGGGNP
jgi:hypothetical protein